MDKSWLPSKKLVLSFATLAILLLGSVAVSELFNKNDVYLGNNSVKVAELRGNFSEKDIDGDGLMDWEENLWKTDINNSDTDGDGTNDGDEILQKRNPAVAGPDDLLPENTTLNKEDILKYSDEENLTETDKLSRDFLISYLSMKKEGSFETNKTQLIESLTQDVTKISKETTGKFYTSADINIINSNKKSDLDTYKKIFINIMMFSNKPSQDISIFKDALQSDNGEEIKQLDSSISLYEDMMKDLLRMNVPSSLQQSHLIIVNSFDDMIEGTKKMRNVMIDPVGGLSGINLRIVSEEVFLVGLNKLNDILEK